MGGAPDLLMLMRAVGSGDRRGVLALLTAQPGLVLGRLERDEEFFFAECHAQVYAGDTALHVAAFAHDAILVSDLVAHGADVRARNRRGAEPLHAAMTGGPGSASWEPTAQVAALRALIASGADPNAAAAGGVTPLHRAVRNRCSAAVQALIELGADPKRRNDNGSTAMQLAQWTTGRGGSGSPEAKTEQQIIKRLIAAAQ
jgi:Ankyrin repeats (many copies)/Ankyrin repeat